MLVAAENLEWRNIGKSLWEQFDVPTELRTLTGRTRASLETILMAFVRARNDGAEGHGISGGYDRLADIALLRCTLERLQLLLPQVEAEDRLIFVVGETRIPVQTLKLSNGNPICYRRIRPAAGGRVLIEAQEQVSSLNRAEIVYEAADVLSNLPAPQTGEYDIGKARWTDEWAPFVYLPERLAAPDIFTGRKQELLDLSNWANDPDSRVCLLYGDGGVGKTTLVVEFLHRLLEEEATASWRPELITFYTAKQTRWGVGGLERISARDVGVADAAVTIAKMLSSTPLDRSWFDKEPKDLIQKLGAFQGEMKISRDQHLLVLDNTETMAKSDEDVIALGAQIKELSRRVGRVLLTSRRRETLEAHPIAITAWSDEEGGAFLHKRGALLKSTPIAQAGLAALKRASRRLGNKPIVLEVFVQAASAPGIGLDAAIERVQRMQRADLGHFLYEDAWNRMAHELRHVLLLMTRVSDLHDQYLMQLCCAKANVTMVAASEALEESKGIATVSRVAGNIQVVFNPEFFAFCAERTEFISGHTVPMHSDIDWVKKRYADFLKSASTHVTDRNARAYRHPYARAAWTHFNERRTEEALQFYELAEEADASNGWLLDRYAYTLFTLRRHEQALEKAARATGLLPDDSECWFTRGIVEARLGRVETSGQSLMRAEKLGKPTHLCCLQMAYAQINRNPPDLALASRLLDTAQKQAPKDGFYPKFQAEVRSFRQRWLPEETAKAQ